MGGKYWYDTARICLNGHVITDDIKTSSEESFCDRCGAATITECGKCRASIRGCPHAPWGEFAVFMPYKAPAFCFNCGVPFPWTESSLKAAHDLANEISEIEKGERDILNQSLDDLVRDTPQTEVAAVRFKRIVSKLGPEVAGAFKTIVINIASETAKRIILGP